MTTCMIGHICLIQNCRPVADISIAHSQDSPCAHQNASIDDDALHAKVSVQTKGGGGRVHVYFI